MSGPFNVGDVVVCVDDSPCRRPDIAGLPFQIKRGAVLRVAAVLWDIDRLLCLRFVTGPKPSGGVGFIADRFRHIPKADEQFTAQIRACRPVRESEAA